MKTSILHHNVTFPILSWRESWWFSTSLGRKKQCILKRLVIFTRSTSYLFFLIPYVLRLTVNLRNGRLWAQKKNSKKWRHFAKWKQQHLSFSLCKMTSSLEHPWPITWFSCDNFLIIFHLCVTIVCDDGHRHTFAWQSQSSHLSFFNKISSFFCVFLFIWRSINFFVSSAAHGQFISAVCSI